MMITNILISKMQLKSLTMTLPNAITEQKKAKLDALAIQILAAQHDVEQHQAIVASLTHKNVDFQRFLHNTKTNLDQIQNNKLLAAQLAENVAGLTQTSATTFSETTIAEHKTKELSGSVKQLIDKLIYSVEFINKLAVTIVRKKALNPLISDELVSMITKAGTDANNAVALTLIALKSGYITEASNMESFTALKFEHHQALNLHNIIQPQKAGSKSLKSLIDKAYDDTAYQYQSQQAASGAVTSQLNSTQNLLNKAQTKLQSLQAGLAAANTAVFAE